MSIHTRERSREENDDGVSRRGFLGALVAARAFGAVSSPPTAVRRSAQAAAGAGASHAPALLGGTPVRRTPFPSWPIADAREEDALVRVIRSGRWNRGDNVAAFESAYAALTGARHCLATANGTSALIASLAALGVREHHWLDYADGECASADAPTAIEAVRSIIDAANAHTVVTFGPDGMTGHPDHVTVGHWATVAATLASGRPRVLHATKTADWAEHFASLHERVPVFGPQGPPRTEEADVAFAITLSPCHLDQKMVALRAQATQTATVIDLVGEDTYRSWLAREWFVCGDSR